MITRNKTREISEALIKVRNFITDEQAKEVLVLFPVWRENMVYNVNERVIYNNELYKTLLTHTSQLDWTPDTAKDFFIKI